jgi:hypothetical protein
MLLQLQNKNKVVSPSKRTRKHKGSGDKASRKADREYMANNVNPVKHPCVRRNVRATRTRPSGL